MRFIPKLWAERADQKHVNNRSRLVSAPGANYFNGCQTLNVTCHVHVKVDHAGQGNNRQGIRSLSSFSLESKYKEFGSLSLWRTLVPTCLKCNWQYFRREKESLIQIGFLASYSLSIFKRVKRFCWQFGTCLIYTHLIFSY